MDGGVPSNEHANVGEFLCLRPAFRERSSAMLSDVPSIFVGGKASHPRQSLASTGRVERLGVDEAGASHYSLSSENLEVNDSERVEGIPPCPPVVSDNTSVKALEGASLQERVLVLQEQLQESRKEAANLREVLEETLAKADAFGFTYASKYDKVLKFYTGTHVQDFMDLTNILGDSAQAKSF